MLAGDNGGIRLCKARMLSTTCIALTPIVKCKNEQISSCIVLRLLVILTLVLLLYDGEEELQCGKRYLL